jgi:hypothetical protein
MAKNEPITPDGSLDRFGETQQGNNQALETPPRSQSYSTKPAPTANMSAEAALTKSGKAALALQRVLDSLDDADGELYYQFATVTRKEVAKDEDKKREFHEDLCEFIVRNKIIGLHNTYAALLKRSGPNAAFQLPIWYGEDEEES